MYSVYSRAGSGGFVVEAALDIAGQKFRLLSERAGSDNPDFARVSPLRQVPVLVLPDGRSLTESAAICLLLAERHPDAGLAPAPGSPERIDFLRWLTFMAATLYPALLRFYYAERSTTDVTGIEAVKAAAVIESDRHFGIIEQALDGRAWIAGEPFSIADVYLLMLAHWVPGLDRPRPEWTNIMALCDRVKAIPAVARLNESHRFW